MRPRFLRLITIALALIVIGFAGSMLFNYVAAHTAREIPLDPTTRAIAEQAKVGYLSQVPLSFTIIRLVVTSVEECGEGNYFVLFDVYHWFGRGKGRGKGFAKYTNNKGVTGGGSVSDEEELEELIYYFRTWCR